MIRNTHTAENGIPRFRPHQVQGTDRENLTNAFRNNRDILGDLFLPVQDRDSHRFAPRELLSMFNCWQRVTSSSRTGLRPSLSACLSVAKPIARAARAIEAWV